MKKLLALKEPPTAVYLTIPLTVTATLLLHRKLASQSDNVPACFG
jgi:hypothetical protein